MFPHSSAEYEYVKNAMGNRVAFIIGWIIILSAIISSTTVAIGFANYLDVIFDLPNILSSISLILILSFILFVGIKESARIAILFTSIEIVGLLIIAFIGIPHYGTINYLEAPLGFNGIFASAALIFFAYLGFEEIVKLSDETKDPHKNIPRGIIIAMVISTVLYILVAFSSVSILGWEGLSQSHAPFSQIAYSAFGRNGLILLSIITLFATSNTVLLTLLAGSRIVYGMSRCNSLPKIFSRVHYKTRTPWTAIIVISLASITFLFLGKIDFLASVTNYMLFASFIVINASVIILRYTAPYAERHFKIPLSIKWIPILPILGIITCIILLLNLEYNAIILGIILTIIGLLLSFLKRKN